MLFVAQVVSGSGFQGCEFGTGDKAAFERITGICPANPNLTQLYVADNTRYLRTVNAKDGSMPIRRGSG